MAQRHFVLPYPYMHMGRARARIQKHDVFVLVVVDSRAVRLCTYICMYGNALFRYYIHKFLPFVYNAKASEMNAPFSGECWLLFAQRRKRTINLLKMRFIYWKCNNLRLVDIDQGHQNMRCEHVFSFSFIFALSYPSHFHNGLPRETPAATWLLCVQSTNPIRMHIHKLLWVLLVRI